MIGPKPPQDSRPREHFAGQFRPPPSRLADEHPLGRLRLGWSKLDAIVMTNDVHQALRREQIEYLRGEMEAPVAPDNRIFGARTPFGSNPPVPNSDSSLQPLGNVGIMRHDNDCHSGALVNRLNGRNYL